MNSLSSSDRATDVYSKMLSRQKRSEKSRTNDAEIERKKAEEAEMERLRQIRQQEQNELHIKAEVDKRVQNEVTCFIYKNN